MTGRRLPLMILNGGLTAIRILAGLIISKLIAIYAGPAGLAMVGQLANFTSIIHGMAAAPVGAGLVRYTSEHRDGGPAACAPWWQASLLWLGAICLAMAVPAWLLRTQLAYFLFHSHGYEWCIGMVLVALPFASLATLATSVNNGLANYPLLMKAGLLGICGSTAICAACIVYWGLDGALVATAIGMAVTGVAVAVLSLAQPWMRAKWWLGRPERAQLIDIRRFTSMALATAVLAPITQVLIRNHLIIGYGQEATGLWQAAGRISDAYLAIITSALSLIYLPALARVKSYGQLREEMLDVLKLAAPLAIGLSLGVYLLRDVVISILFSTNFKAASDFMGYQAAGDTLKIISWIWSYALIARGATRTFIFSEIVFCGLYYLLVVEFTGRSGIIGAAQAYALVYLIYLVFMMLAVPRVLSREFFRVP